jgi:hypothetical protein
MEDRSYTEQWMVEGAIGRFVEWTVGGKNKKQCEEKKKHVLFDMFFSCFEFSGYQASC